MSRSNPSLPPTTVDLHELPRASDCVPCHAQRIKAIGSPGTVLKQARANDSPLLKKANIISAEQWRVYGEAWLRVVCNVPSFPAAYLVRFWWRETGTHDTAAMCQRHAFDAVSGVRDEQLDLWGDAA